ncbi:MAG TPA: hypothetical protein VF135_12010 [Terriglobales bacterium]
MKRFTLSLLALLLLIGSALGQTGKKKSDLLFEYVGQVTNSGPSSAQYGNLTNIAGQSGTFTFYTIATNVSVTNNGSIRVIDRSGTTTIYLANAAGDFSNPDSFRAGTPVQVSDLKQQVIVDTATGAFTVLNVNTITSVVPFPSNDEYETLGDEGQVFRTSLTGHLNPGAPPPSGWFGGYAVSAR